MLTSLVPLDIHQFLYFLDDFHSYEGYFGALDVSYLAAYAVGMFIRQLFYCVINALFITHYLTPQYFFSGHVAERMNLRYFLSAGMILSGVMTLMFGLGYTWGIHYIAFYIAVQVCSATQRMFHISFTCSDLMVH